MAQAPLATVFMAERRPEAFHDMALPAGDILGLCAWRTRLAEALRTADPGGTRTFGVSWARGCGGKPCPTGTRTSSTAGWPGACSLGGREHAPAHLSVGKAVRCFRAGGTAPLCRKPRPPAARPGPARGRWVNLHGQTSQEAAVTVGALSCDASFLAAYAQAQGVLARLWLRSGGDRGRTRAPGPGGGWPNWGASPIWGPPERTRLTGRA